MSENKFADRLSVYEVGYLLAGIPEDKVESENLALREIIIKNGSEIIAEEAPRQEQLAYTMRKKTVSGSYEKYDQAYFGWIKFEASTDKTNVIKNQIEAMPSVLRILITTATRENTYLGKRASIVAASISRKPEGQVEGVVSKKEDTTEPPATIEEMDKSIDEMVKEV